MLPENNKNKEQQTPSVGDIRTVQRYNQGEFTKNERGMYIRPYDQDKTYKVFLMEDCSRVVAFYGYMGVEWGFIETRAKLVLEWE